MDSRLKVPWAKAHPWHGISPGIAVPRVVNCYIEIVPTDTVKYEVDKETGHLRVDRPQKYSNHCPTLYGFIPQTYCGTRVGELSCQRVDRSDIRGDGDPLDVCVITERPVQHGDILVRGVPIGGLRLIDSNEADDKIIAVLEDDSAYGAWRDIRDCPEPFLDRLKHYFLTYKEFPGVMPRRVEIAAVYGISEAHDVILRSVEDYTETFRGESVSLFKDRVIDPVQS